MRVQGRLVISRAGVVAAVGRRSARCAPAGHYPVNELYPWVTVAGCSLDCARCGREGRAPLPRAEGYNQAVEAFLAEHRRCGKDAGGEVG